MIFVYPYRRDLDHGDELKISISSIKKHYHGDVKIIVVGKSKPDFVNDNDFMPFDDRHRTKEANIGHVIKKICSSLDDNDEFVWMNDDMVLIKDIDRSFFKVPYYWKDLAGEDMPRALLKYQARPWERRVWFTIFMLHEHGRTLLHFETHLPYLFNVGKMKVVLDALPVAHGATLPATSYMNFFDFKFSPKKAKEICLFIYNGEFDKKMISDSHIWFNYNNISYKSVIDYLRERFL